VYLAMPLPMAGLPLTLTLELGGAVLVAVFFALLAGSLFARRVIPPLRDLSRAAAAVSAGDLNQRLPTGSGISEINELGQAFNNMTASLRQSTQAKNAFVADVTHELRTPLTVIKGTIETLEDGALDDLAGRGPLLQAMQRETERLIRLVNDLLVLTRADAGTLNLEMEPLDLAELARERCAHLAGLAARREVSLVVSGAESAWVLGDADRLAQVLDNLLDNAIRYSPAQASVTVEIACADGSAVCAVCDDGPGLAEKHLALVFERFYRADASRNRQTGGAGLGLAIVRALLTAQNGGIRVESTVGQGSTFRFWLPLAPRELNAN
jgi:signal transduction histidine kinase